MFDKLSDMNNEMYFLGDMNIDWLGQPGTNKNHVLSILNACNLYQIVTQPTRTSIDSDGIIVNTCTDHIYTDVPDLCSKVVSMPIGFSDHNIIAVTRKIKLQKIRANIIYTFI